MATNDLARVVLQTTDQLVTRVGFGTPMFVGACAAWGASPDRTRTYSAGANLADLVADGFAVTDPEYLAAAALLSQPNPPPTYKLGRRANLPTQQWVLTPTAQNLTVYTVTVDGHDAVFTSDGNATVAEICTGIKAAIDALALAVTTTNEGPGNDVKVLANAAGAWHSVKAMQAANPLAPNAFLDIKQNHADPGITADLNAIRAADADWYGFTLTTNGAAEIAAAAAWAEANAPIIFLPLTNDSGCYGNGNTDIASTLKGFDYGRTGALYHHDPRQCAAAAWMGYGLPTTPGTENWANMPLKGVEPTSFTQQQKTNLFGDPSQGPGGKFCNAFYSPVGGITATRMGTMAGGEYIDTVRFLDSFKIGAEEDAAQIIADAGALGSKIGFDDKDLAKFENVLRARVKASPTAIADDPAPTFITPLASSFTPTQRKSRVLTGLGCTFELVGAINFALITVTAS